MANITVAGHITSDAQQKTVTTANGPRVVTTFTVADNGNPNRPEFYRFSAWSNQASKLVTYAKKGRAVVCTGSNLKASPYTDRNGKPAASLDLQLDSITWMDAFAGRQEAAAPAPDPAPAIVETAPEMAPQVLPF